MPLDKIPNGLEAARSSVSQLLAFSDTNGVSPLNLCLGYAQAIPWANGLVIGATTALQLREIVESRIQLPAGWDLKIDRLPEDVLDPRRWPK
jgi:aryl-alcohol dehydrogenase-like predicted oxidoreductase